MFFLQIYIYTYIVLPCCKTISRRLNYVDVVVDDGMISCTELIRGCLNVVIEVWLAVYHCKTTVTRPRTQVFRSWRGSCSAKLCWKKFRASRVGFMPLECSKRSCNLWISEITLCSASKCRKT